MHTSKFLSLIIISCTITVFNESNSNENKEIDNIIIEHSPNDFHYIYYNGKRILIEDAQEEMSNKGLLKLTNSCIEVNSVYETKNKIEFNNCNNHKQFNMFLKNNSNINNYEYILNFSKNQIIPLNIEVCNNTVLHIYSNSKNALQINTLNINEGSTLIQHGTMSINNLINKGVFEIYGTVII